MHQEHRLADGAAQDTPLGAPTETSDQTAEADTKRKQAEARRLRRLKLIFPFLLLLVFLVYAFTTNFVPSESMLPNLRPGDHIITMRAWLAYFDGRTPRRGDIVVFILPARQAAQHSEEGEPVEQGRVPFGVFRLPPGIVLVKRVVGLPGDTVQVTGGVVSINGRKLAEHYETMPGDPDYDGTYSFAVEQPLKLGPDELFVMGDNRNNSEDSRVWGPLQRKNLIGKCVGVLFHEGPNGLNEKEARRDQLKNRQAPAPMIGAPRYLPGRGFRMPR